MVLVCSGSVMVFGMIVTAVDVCVQGGELTGSEHQRHSDQNRYESTHNASLRDATRTVKRARRASVEDGETPVASR